MPRAVSDSNRIDLRLKAEDKAILAQAAALKNKDLSGFILEAALPVAKETIEHAGKLVLSERDSLKLLALLENPPKPNAKLKAAWLRMKKTAPAAADMRWRISSLDKQHDRRQFDCGDATLNEYLQRFARQNHERGGAKKRSWQRR